MNALVPRFACGQQAWRDWRGVAALEFALISPVLIALLLGLYDVGTAVRHQLMLQQALRTAGQYAMMFPTQSAGITQAVVTALPNQDGISSPDWSGLQVSACTCGGGASTPGCAVNACPGGGGQYVILNATVPWSFLFLSISIPLNSASYVVRVQ